MDITFDVPQGMTAEQLAQKFTAILRQIRGERADVNRDGAYGPFRKRENSDESWQLDGTNNYWLHIHEGGKANLRCRYTVDEATIKEAVRLFSEAQSVPQ